MNSIPRGVVRSLAPILSLFALAAIAAYPLISAAGTDTFEYDELGRLKKVTYANGTSTTYTLDAAGNRTALNTGSSSSSSGGSSGGPPTYIAITSSTGAILPSASSLYSVSNYCQPAGPSQSVCFWEVRKSYGNYSPVALVVKTPPGSIPACASGTTQQIASGYVRSACVLTALSTVYGQ